ncbi:MAG: 1-(5-phosphoribosyl)-5-[(5-phosphoribosylamino)methylideneamino]imidazole-4-carboxamide isomerase [SAR202 cluster bacterium Io17-Chloro-G2]|nr:MAG: 1-(5-phosphoribosyl)-5-[(5-phosphoribosylamino)methylideneamino]imidazole-4-carboxamide isomerase [SAR202 cluster bacterium Io17-Chloro-G2]
MEIIPSIDLKSGRCVRLFQGDFQQETVFSEDPVSVALQWQNQGATRLHLVDLDGAAQGTPANKAAISEILDCLSIPVQIGGGIRSVATAEALITQGAGRVVIGTAAVEDPDMVRTLCASLGSERVVVALDARDGKVATRGWTEDTSVNVLALAGKMAGLGVTRLLYTDISRDGTLTQPNYQANRELAKSSGMAVLASGGIAALEHVYRLKRTGVEGAIVGTALYTGALDLAEAIEAAGAQTPT